MKTVYCATSMVLILIVGQLHTHAGGLGTHQSEVPVNESRVRLIQSGADDAFNDGVEALRTTYRKRLAHQLDIFTDEIIIFKLDGETVREDNEPADPFHPSDIIRQRDRFPVWPYDGTSGIVEIKRFKQTEKGYADVLWAFCELLEQGLSYEGPFSHHPDYGLRFLHQGEILFETSLSLRTGNCYVSYPDRYMWEGIDPKHDEALAAMLESAFGEKPKTR